MVIMASAPIIYAGFLGTRLSDVSSFLVVRISYLADKILNEIRFTLHEIPFSLLAFSYCLRPR